jgi:pimeloyl-ACP methyl ester carboxylesterase
MNAANLAFVSPDMTTFVLLHGNFHDGSAWHGVTRRLEQLGHVAHAPTLPGHGQDGRTDVGYREAAQTVAGGIVEQDLRDVVLVGHSGGGVAISRTVELIPDRVQRLVYISGWVLRDGESILGMCPLAYRDLFAGMAAESPDHTVWVPMEVWQSNFINGAEEATAKSAFEHLVPEPYSYLVERAAFGVFHSLPTPKSYILPTEDIVLPRDDEWGWHPRMTSRLGEHRFIQLPGSHEVMFTNPSGLADAIVEACID